jgi:NAD(P)-dependent dehydrogenase (short-subunit alcohol dehydrogenase family)
MADCVTPGSFETDILEHVPESTLGALLSGVPIKRLSQPDEAAALIAWMCSEEWLVHNRHHVRALRRASHVLTLGW